ncbi:MAG: phosphatidate cytidylyltransferase [Bdellovibrionaceae bacterium]|nr:phosphatidate cytidylyltransferase [Pseudobdellovibrionaceae bacterium]
MNDTSLWSEALYRETVGLVIIFLLVTGSILFVLRKKNPKLTTAWVSTKSWIFAAPIILFFIGLPAPYPLFTLILISIFSAKTFFRMVGIYHRTWFVLLTYFFIFVLGYMIFEGKIKYFNLMPMIFLCACAFIPILRNSYTHMIQYIALSLICFIFMGWSFLHLGLILNFDKGIYICLYLYLLAEFSFNSAVFFGRFYGKYKVLDKISPRFTIEGFIFSFIITLLLAWGMRHMLPNRSEPFWLASALIITFFGRCGDIILSVIRRDLGIKDSGVFIIGREDILSRVDKFIFAAPIFYYTFKILMQMYPVQ